MKLFSFSYNISLIILFAIAFASCFFAYIYSKKRIFLFSGLAFLFYILDVFIIYNAEFLSYGINFNENAIPHITYPILKVIVRTGICLLYLLILLTLIEKTFHAKYLFLVFLFFFTSVSLIMFPESKLQLWCFYILLALNNICLCIFYFYCVKSSKDHDYKVRIKKYNTFFIISFIIGIFIIIEYSVEIPNISRIAAYLPNLNERNFTEDLISIFYSIVGIKLACKTLFSPYHTQGYSMFPDATDTLNFKKQLEFFCHTYNLTNREKEVLNLLLEDKDTQKISELLYISIGTTKTHIHNIYRKTGTGKKNELIHLFQNTAIINVGNSAQEINI